MKWIITIRQDDDGVFIAECPSIPGCISQGATKEEAEYNLRDAIRECLAMRKEQGLPLAFKTRKRPNLPLFSSGKPGLAERVDEELAGFGE